MINILMPLTDKDISIEVLMEKFSLLKNYSPRLIIACERDNKILEDIKANNNLEDVIPTTVFTYPKGTSEEGMIEATLKNISNSAFVLLRNDTQIIDIALIEKLIIEGQFGADVAMAKKKNKQSKIRAFFEKLTKKVSDFVLNFNFYQGDIGVQYFSELAHSIMKNGNLTLLTKLDRWLGLSIKYIEHDIDKTKIKHKDFGIAFVMLGIYSLLFIGCIVAPIVISVVVMPLNFIIWTLFIVADIILITLIFVRLLAIFSVNKVGDISAENTPLIKQEDYFIIQTFEKPVQSENQEKPLKSKTKSKKTQSSLTKTSKKTTPQQSSKKAVKTKNDGNV